MLVLKKFHDSFSPKLLSKNCEDDMGVADATTATDFAGADYGDYDYPASTSCGSGGCGGGGSGILLCLTSISIHVYNH